MNETKNLKTLSQDQNIMKRTYLSTLFILFFPTIFLAHLLTELPGTIPSKTNESLFLTCTDNLLINPGFEDSDTLYTPWYTQENPDNISISNDAYSGTNALLMDSTTTIITQEVPAVSGMEYIASAWVKKASGWVKIGLTFKEGNSVISGFTSSAIYTNVNYEEITISRFAPPNTTAVEFIIYRSTWGLPETFIDHCCLIASDPCNPDTIAPVVTNCPEDISLMSISGGEIITWNEIPIAADDCMATISNDYNSGDFFPIGVTPVTYTATDPSGNIGTCSFNVDIAVAPFGSLDMLVANLITPDTLEAGNFYTFQVDAINPTNNTIIIDNSSITISIYLSGSTGLIGSYDLPELDPGITIVDVFTFIPFDIQAEEYYTISAVLDYRDFDEDFIEINEINNTVTLERYVSEFSSSPCVHDFPLGDNYDCAERLASGDLRVVTTLVDSTGLHYYENIIDEAGEVMYSNSIPGPYTPPNYLIENGQLYEVDYFENPIDSTPLSADLLMQNNLQNEVLFFDNGYIFLNLNEEEDTLTIVKTDELMNISNSVFKRTSDRFDFVESLVELTPDRFAFIYNIEDDDENESVLIVMNPDLEIISSSTISTIDGSGAAAPPANLHQNDCGLWVMYHVEKDYDETYNTLDDESIRYTNYYTFENDAFELVKEYIYEYNRWSSPTPTNGSDYRTMKSRTFRGIAPDGNILTAFRTYRTRDFWGEPDLDIDYIPAYEELLLSKTSPNGDTIWQKTLLPAIAWPFTELVQICNSYFLLHEGNYLNVDCLDDSPGFVIGPEIPYNGIDDDCDLSTLDDDLDQDGFLLAEDCDDTDPSIGSAEIPYNGIDDDCNPATLDDDLDQDGFNFTEDCDDNNALSNPSLVEIPYNGIDDDCDPSTLDDDFDQDGFGIAEDCDDDNALANPSLVEIPYNGFDDDCDMATPDDDLDGDGALLVDDCDDTNPLVSYIAPRNSLQWYRR